MSEYLVDENKNLVPYSEPSGSLPVVVTSVMANRNLNLYCNDYGNGGSYILCLQFVGGNVHSGDYFKLYGCMTEENSAYLVNIAGSNNINLIVGSAYYIQTPNGTLDENSNWAEWSSGFVLNDTKMVRGHVSTNITFTGEMLVFQCIKLW